MTQQQFEELKSLIHGNTQGISRNFEMLGRMYEEHGGQLQKLDRRLAHVEVVQEQFSHDLRAVAKGVTGNAERLGRLEGRFDGLEVRFDQMEGRFDGLEVRFDQLEGRFDRFDVKFDHLSG